MRGNEFKMPFILFNMSHLMMFPVKKEFILAIEKLKKKERKKGSKITRTLRIGE